MQGVKSSKETVEADKGNNDGQEKQRSKKKDKGKKGRKGKGKKSNKDISEKDKAALKDFLDTFREKRRLMVRAGCKQRAKYAGFLTHLHLKKITSLEEKKSV